MTKQFVRLVCAGLLLTTGAALAFIDPAPSPLAEKETRIEGLDAEPMFFRTSDLDAAIAGQLEADLTVLGLDPQYAVFDARSGQWATLWLKHPMIPGTGVGNQLSWDQLGQAAAPGTLELGNIAWNELVDFVGARRAQLGIDPAEMIEGVGVASRGEIVQIHATREVGGVPVRGANVTATINHGNLILFGSERWGLMDVSTVPTLSRADAEARLESHLAPFSPDGYRSKAHLEILPIGTDGVVGQGYTHRLAWILEPDFDSLIENYEAAIDAHSGEVLLLQDTNHYATRNVKGGVYPVSYDGIGPEGVEQPGWPMPFIDVTHTGGTETSDSGGNIFDISGDITVELDGPYVTIDEQCGAVSETSSSGDLDLGTSSDPDCDVPPGASSGNTHAARTAFYELNRIKEQGRGHWPDPGPPAHAWLNAQLEAETNLSGTCNAFWTGSIVQFYQEFDICGNTGQLAGVFDHEWGHGIDDNGTAGSISSPGEGIPDVYAGLRLNSSCIGRGFFQNGQLCGGYGDPCTMASGCTGIRDIDYANRTSGQPHDVDWVNGNGSCGSSHCRGAVYSESIWDLFKRDLPTFYGMDNNTAMEVATRLTYLGADNVTTWYSLTNGDEGGCAATSGYQQFLGVDDDNGDLTDGTPHMEAIYSAFDRHQIACATPTVQDAGCAGAPTAAPTVAISPNDTGADLSWAAVPDAARYKIFRTDGVAQCDFGKAIVGETTGTSFSDGGLQNDREYSYVVAAFGTEDTCMGPTSACATVIPQAGLAAANSSVAICAGTDAEYTLTVSAPFAPPVDVSVSGNPAGTTAVFLPDPVNGPLPEDTVLTIGNTGAVAAGDYLMTATADDTSIMFNANLTLSVFDSVPGAPTLTMPTDTEADVVLSPTFQWDPAFQGGEYFFVLDDDPLFASPEHTETLTATTLALPIALAPETTYYWQVGTENICGVGAASAQFSFTTAAIPPVLLVDDDDNSPDTQGMYTTTLNSILGVAGYDVWDTNNSNNEPTSVDLSPYQFVVWFSGDEFGGSAGPGAAGEAALASWLDSQEDACLLISSQDYHYDMDLTSFMQNYLGTGSVTDDNGDYTSISGTAAGPFDGLGPMTLNYGALDDYPDTIVPNANGSLAMVGNNSNGAAVHRDGGDYNTFFMVFPMEAFSVSDREAVINAVMTECQGEPPEPPFWADGFETGDTTMWSMTVPAP